MYIRLLLMLLCVCRYRSDVKGSTWLAVTLTSSQYHFAKVAEFAEAAADDQWHYECVDMLAALDAMYGAQEHQITAIIFWVPHTGRFPFYIDEFSVSSQPRTVIQTKPRYDMGRARIAGVEAAGNDDIGQGTRTWYVCVAGTGGRTGL